MPFWQFVGRFGRLRPSLAPVTPSLPQDTKKPHFYACSSTRIASNAAGGAHVAVSSPLATALWRCLNWCLFAKKAQCGAFCWCLIPTKAPKKGTTGALVAKTGAFLRKAPKPVPIYKGTKKRHQSGAFLVPYVVTPQAAEVTEGGDYGPADTKVGIKVGPNASSAPSSGPGVAALTHRAQGALCLLGACAHMASIWSRPTPTYAVYQAIRPCKKAPKKGTALCLSCEKAPF